ncbi:MAG: Hpt domain-containing protein [Actinobacteria bacterium]|nr:Hpt domain-containing protein [Actinomycetota bacterium]
MASAMDELATRFKAEARDRFARITQLAGDAQNADAIREEAHKLKGAAGMLGFPELKDRAAELEILTASGDAAQNEIAAAVEALGTVIPD